MANSPIERYTTAVESSSFFELLDESESSNIDDLTKLYGELFTVLSEVDPSLSTQDLQAILREIGGKAKRFADLITVNSFDWSGSEDALEDECVPVEFTPEIIRVAFSGHLKNPFTFSLIDRAVGDHNKMKIGLKMMLDHAMADFPRIYNVLKELRISTIQKHCGEVFTDLGGFCDFFGLDQDTTDLTLLYKHSRS